MNNINPLISVVIPTHNRKERVVTAVESVVGQTYKNIQILIINDGSMDGTEAVLEELRKKDSRITIIHNEVNLGFVKTLNRGVGYAKGKYIARLDDDDRWSDSDKIKKQVEFMEENPGYGLVGGGVMQVDPDGKEMVRFSLPGSDQEIRKTILISNVFAHSAVVFKKDDFEALGGYDEKFGFFADWDLWLKMGTLGKYHNFQEPFIYYSDQELGLGRTSHDYKIRRRLIANIKLRNKYKKNYPGHAKAIMVCLANYLYSFLPFRKKIWPLLFWARNAVFGPSPYTYFKP